MFENLTIHRSDFTVPRIVSSPPGLLELFEEKYRELFDYFTLSNDGRIDESYFFHYVIPELLAFSKYSQGPDLQRRKEYGVSMLGMSSIDTVLNEHIFNRDMVGIGDDLLFVIQYYKYIPKEEDYQVKNLTSTSGQEEHEECNIEFLVGPKAGKGKLWEKVMKEVTTVTFDLINHRTLGNTHRIVLKFLENTFKSCMVYTIETNQHILDIDQSETPKIVDWNYIKDVNGFLNTLHQVYCTIQEYLPKKRRK